jgi:nucleoid-associated protein YgaU
MKTLNGVVHIVWGRAVPAMLIAVFCFNGLLNAQDAVLFVKKITIDAEEQSSPGDKGSPNVRIRLHSSPSAKEEAKPEAKAVATEAQPQEAPVSTQENVNVTLEKVQDKPKKIYKVRIWQETGDTLRSIAGKMYGDPLLWHKIYEANKDDISDPDKIYPNQELVIPELDQ